MKQSHNENISIHYTPQEYESAVVKSALWAAAGDALGWMTELSNNNVGAVKARTGLEFVSETVEWKRIVGGRSGVKVNMPAGTYSDDTQLRLCVSRAIRGNGTFDVEAFAKIELPVWQGYALGAGIGSKSAAANLSKRGVNWFSNFFSGEKQKYITAGGNGAAMRVQPHVWSARKSKDEMVLQVFKDAIVTHGHPHGFCGAIFHALCLWDTFKCREIPGLDSAKEYIDYVGNLLSIIFRDNELNDFWLPSWERESDRSMQDALSEFQAEARDDLKIVEELICKNKKPSYQDLLNSIGCLSERYRGSGFKTALAALLLSKYYSENGIEKTIIISANELASDTDTIATMAGGMLGAINDEAPGWVLQDRNYLEFDAKRLAGIGLGRNVRSFDYPDMSTWEPPTNQSDAVKMLGGSFELSGLGALSAVSNEYKNSSAIWQWFKLPFGQSVLAKRRIDSNYMEKEQGRARSYVGSSNFENSKVDLNARQDSFSFPEKDKSIDSGRGDSESGFPGLDEATNKIISSGFDDVVIGKMVKQCIDSTGSIELTVSLVGIVAKARISRMRKK